MESKKEIELSALTSTSTISNSNVYLDADTDEDHAKRSRIEIGSDSKIDCAKPGPSRISEELKNFDSGIQSGEKLLSNFVPLRSLPSATAVFSIPKILERIFYYSDPQDLLRFRLVSQDWRREATNDRLLYWGSNKIQIDRNFDDHKLHACHFNQDKKFSKPLQEWAELMNKTGLNTFPCIEFNIDFDKIGGLDDEEVLVAFVSNHGNRIKYLFLRLTYYKRCDEIFEGNNSWCSHGEKWCNVLITKLVEKMPNLENLKFGFYTFGQFGVWFVNQTQCLQTFGLPCNPQINDSNESKKDTVGRLNLKLQTISILENVPKSVFEHFCRLSPNLKTLTDYDLSHYIEPINRLHLLTTLTYRPGSSRPEWNLFVERIVNMKTELQLNALYIFTSDIRQRPEDWLHVADICNRLLIKCVRCLKKLTLSRMGFLPGFKIPEMPNVNCLNLSGGGSISSEIKFFPRGMRISEAFPKLHTIQLVVSCNDSEVLGHDFLSDSVCGELCVPSVKVVNTFGRVMDLDLLQRVFPNARFVDLD